METTVASFYWQNIVKHGHMTRVGKYLTLDPSQTLQTQTGFAIISNMFYTFCICLSYNQDQLIRMNVECAVISWSVTQDSRHRTSLYCDLLCYNRESQYLLFKSKLNLLLITLKLLENICTCILQKVETSVNNLNEELILQNQTLTALSLIFKR